jgi:hypothetical protein
MHALGPLQGEATYYQEQGGTNGSVWQGRKQVSLKCNCFAPDFLDTELSVFMQQLRAQGAAGALGLV